jgi:WD40 repeat protein
MRPFIVALLALCLLPAARGQSGCPPLQAPAPDPAKLLFTPQQEMELGEIVRQQMESEFLVIEEDRVTGYLKRVGERVARHLPNTGLRYEFLLYDQPEIQAFSMPGGRVYVSRKMVAFLRSEDELASLLGHELGHLAARQQAVEISRDFREVLGIKSLPADDDLFERYNQLVDRIRLRKRHFTGEEEKGQEVADQLGVQAVVRAGYAPQAFPDLLDRLMQTKGATGSWISDLFGATRPDSKRLRLALKDVSSLPSACIEAKASAPQGEEFHQWQAAVLHYQGIGHAEHLPGVLMRRQLNDPLRGDIEHFRFSPDGKYLLAQDEGGIYVLTREPLKFVFRIDAADAEHAQFSPDSRQILLFNAALGVETWDIEHQEQTGVVDVPALHGCRQTALAPDGRYLACFSEDMSLTLYEVASGETIYKAERFFDLAWSRGDYNLMMFLYLLTRPELATLRFSPDGHYFAASSRSKEAVIVDLATQKKINIAGGVRSAMEQAFTFVGPDRIVGIDGFRPEKSPLVEFPSGKVLDHFPLYANSLVAASNPKYVLAGPLKEHPVGAYDLAQKKIVFANRTSATDVWDDTSVSERLNGEIGLYKVNESTPKSVLTPPLGRLGLLRSLTTSPDLKWLAMSSRTRGGVWDLETNTRVFLVRGFQDAYYAPSSVFFLDLPKFEKADREITAFSLATKQPLGRAVAKDDQVTLFGSVMLRSKHSDKDRGAHRNLQLEVVDTVTETALWSRTFPKQSPDVHGSPLSEKVVLAWSAKSDGLREEIARNPRFQERWTKENPGEGDYFLEVVNARDGTVAGAVVLRTGKYSFVPEHLEVMGDWLVVADNHHRVLLYSVATGERKAQMFGYRPEISQNGERLCLANGRGHLAVYDLRSLKQTSELSFANRISSQLFSGDGKRLFVLTNDQSAFILDAAAVDMAGEPGR